MGGAESVTLLVSEMPFHNHNVMVSSEIADVQIPTVDVCYGRSGGGSAYIASNAGLQAMAPQMLAPAGGSLPHNNMQPYVTLNYCIALQGVFPARP